MLTYKEYKKYKQKRKELHETLWLFKRNYQKFKVIFEKCQIDRENHKIYLNALHQYQNQKELYNSINNLLRLHKILYKQTLK